MHNTDLKCPKCHCRDVYRMQRVGILQIVLYPLLGYFPWECCRCRKTYLLKGRNFHEREQIEQRAH